MSDETSQPVAQDKGQAVALAPQEAIKPTTTAEEQLHSASQRRVNLIWEYTQATIAFSVVLATLAGAFVLHPSSDLLWSAFFLIIGFYFGRTNHQNVGGTQLGR